MIQIRQFIFLILFAPALSQSQDKLGTTFSGRQSEDPGPCTTMTSNFMSEQEVERLITEMLDRINIRNRYLIVSCIKVENCQATLYKGKPYILYNPDFLQEVKRLNFSSAEISPTTQNWKALSILAHELGHHVNNHLLNPHPDASARDMELEADQFAGSMIFLMGGTREQALAAYRELPEMGTYSHPGRRQRMEAVTIGWDKVNARNTPPIQERGRTAPAQSNPEPVPVMPKPVSGNPVSLPSVNIGGQTWSKENLNVDHFRNGDSIPEVRTIEEWRLAAEQGKPAWCHFDNEMGNAGQLGKLYNWYAVNDPRGLAPEGWHIPHQDEWMRLTSHLGGKEDAAGRLKANRGWIDEKGRDESGGNEMGFSALPSGYRGSNGLFKKNGLISHWWCPTEDRSGYNFYYYLTSKGSGVSAIVNSKGVGFSVRCVRD